MKKFLVKEPHPHKLQRSSILDESNSTKKTNFPSHKRNAPFERAADNGPFEHHGHAVSYYHGTFSGDPVKISLGQSQKDQSVGNVQFKTPDSYMILPRIRIRIKFAIFFKVSFIGVCNIFFLIH